MTEVQASPADAAGGRGGTPEQTRRLKSRMNDLNIITHLLSQVPYKPLTPPDITLPRRQPAHGYTQPDLPLHYIPAPF